MPSSIRLKRICEYCGKEFEARTTVTRTCGKQCAKQAYAVRQKAVKVDGSDRQMQTRTEVQAIERVKAKEFLTVRDAAKLLNSSRQTIYNMIQAGTLLAVNLNVKKTLIRRSDIDRLFTGQLIIPFAPDRPTETIPLSECYLLQEAQQKYGVSSKTLYEVIRRNRIPKQYKGKYAYVPKAQIDELLAELTASQVNPEPL
ncbi:helix-turn-helix domain-containing protein [Spirosoma areae]